VIFRVLHKISMVLLMVAIRCHTKRFSANFVMQLLRNFLNKNDISNHEAYGQNYLPNLQYILAKYVIKIVVTLRHSEIFGF
jgi:hypothetical protein